MRVRMLGTGASDGWPNPWCDCASCRAAAAAGIVRGQTSALVDDRLLIDLGPDGPRAALRQGASLSGVETVLVTHGHPDHHAWPAWMWRGWAPTRRPLTLIAPPAVLAAAQPHLDDTVTTIEAVAGATLTAGGYEIRVLPATHGSPDIGPAVLYDVTGPDGTSLLWATDTGPLSEQALVMTQGRAYDALLLELTSAHLESGHHDLSTWPEQVAELRRRGAVAAGTRVLAVHLGHDNPPPAELDALLAQWQASAPKDGDVLDLGGTPAPAPQGRRTLVLGAARSGKSAYAEQLLAAEPAVTYVATAPARADDAEWQQRVTAHQARRPATWRTVETTDIGAHLGDTVLVDDLGLWLTAVLDEADAWDSGDVSKQCAELVDNWRRCSGRAVLVAPEVGAGVVPATRSGRLFRDLLGGLTAELAAASDDVVQVVAGLPRLLR